MFKTITTTALAAALIALPLTPTAQAETDVVYIGGTGTGMTLPFIGPALGGGVPGNAFAERFVPVDRGQVTNLIYDGSPIANPHAAVPAALAAVQAHDDPTVVIGLSKGAQVARATEAKDTHAATRYVLIGDPDDDNGISRRLGLSPAKAPITHETTIVVAERDAVGDLPDRPWNLLAVAESLASWAVVHPQYGNGGAGDPLTRLDEADVTVTPNGNGTNTTRKVIPVRELSLTKGLREIERHITGGTWNTDQIDNHLRPGIDAGWSRNDKRVDTTDGNKVEPQTKAGDDAESVKDSDTPNSKTADVSTVSEKTQASEDDDSAGAE